MRELDLVIIGGGPAGLATALSLVAMDPRWRERLVVLEKESYPRHKLCAGGLTPFALRHLKRLGLRLDIPFVEVDRARFEYGGRRFEVRGQPAMVVTRRPEFDHWFAEQAKARGVELREGTPALELRRRPHGIEVETESDVVLAKAIVGADGSRGMVRRWVDAREHPPHVARLLETVTPASGREPEYEDGLARFDFSPAVEDLQGYYWDFPSLIAGQPYMNRGVYDGRLSAGKRRATLPAVLTTYAQAHGADADEIDLEGHPIHWFSPRNKFSEDRVLLVGDAAGAEPLFGEGIGPALGQSHVAATTLSRAFHRHQFGFKEYKRRLLFSSVGGYLILRWALAHVVYKLSGPRASNLGLWWGARLGLWLLGSLPRVDGVLAPPPERRLPG